MSIPSLLPHPLAELFPLMTGADFDALTEDIRANGQHQAIVLFEGKILDGRNRYRACAELGIEPRVEEYHETCSPQSYVASANLRNYVADATTSGLGSRSNAVPSYPHSPLVRVRASG